MTNGNYFSIYRNSLSICDKDFETSVSKTTAWICMILCIFSSTDSNYCTYDFSVLGADFLMISQHTSAENFQSDNFLKRLFLTLNFAISFSDIEFCEIFKN